MGLNSTNREALSFKKLFGKAHTQFSFAIGSEGISSNIQVASSTVFADAIDPLPVTNGGLSALTSTDNIVEKVRFEIEIIPDTLSASNRSQGYALKLPAGYNGILENNYPGGTRLYEALGKLQIVPSLYGELKPNFTTEYDPVLYQTNGTSVISTLNPINWNLDTYNGILFVQDPPANYDISAARPGFLEAYLYVGNYLDSVSGLTGGGDASGERIEREITQVSHGFVPGDILTTSGGTYIKAIALDTEPEALGVVTLTGGTDIFTLTYAGYTEEVNKMTDDSGFGLSGDTVYYLSESVAGKLTPNPPISVGEVIKPLMYVIESGTSANIFQVRGDVVTTGSTGGGGGSATVVNQGGGAEVGVEPSAGGIVEFRTLVGSGDTTVSQVGDNIIIYSDTQEERVITVTTGSSVNVLTIADNVNYIASGTTTYTLPATPNNGTVLTFTDGLGTAGNTTITIQGNGNNIVDDTLALINTNYGSITIEYNGFFWSVTSFNI